MSIIHTTDKWGCLSSHFKIECSCSESLIQMHRQHAVHKMHMSLSLSLCPSLSCVLSFSLLFFLIVEVLSKSLCLLDSCTHCTSWGRRQQDMLGSLFGRVCHVSICCWVVHRCVQYSLANSLQNTVWISRVISELSAYSVVDSLYGF